MNQVLLGLYSLNLLSNVVVSAFSQSSYHDNLIESACDTATSMYLPWTGFRLSRQISTDYVTREEMHSTRLSYCFQGMEYAHTNLEISSSTDEWIHWSGIYCLNTSTIPVPEVQQVHGCYRIARRLFYTTLRVPLLQFDTFIGGIFFCSNSNASTLDPVPSERNHAALEDAFGSDGENNSMQVDGLGSISGIGVRSVNRGSRNRKEAVIGLSERSAMHSSFGDYLCEENEDTIPVAPLLFDEPYMTWQDSSDLYSSMIPFLYTPDRPSIFYTGIDTAWAEYLDVNELYDSDVSSIDQPEISDIYDKLPKIPQIPDMTVSGLGFNQILYRFLQWAPRSFARPVLEHLVKSVNKIDKDKSNTSMPHVL